MTQQRCELCAAVFAPVRVAQNLCAACHLVWREVRLVEEHLREFPGKTTYEEIQEATSIPVDRLRSLADAGALELEPVDRKLCTCPPGESDRCPACRERIARSFGAVVSQIRSDERNALHGNKFWAGRPDDGKRRGLHARRG